MKPVGSIAFMHNGWWITCQPHVMIRLKRVFEGANKSELNTATISDTLQNAYDLRWFVSAHPMTFTPAAAEYLEQRCLEYEARRMAVEQALDLTYVPQTFELKRPARDYQAVAADICLRSRSLLVGDDVGLGKTIVAAAMLTRAETRPALYVTLTHLPKQMQKKFAEFAPQLKTHILKNGPIYDLTKGRRGVTVQFPDVIFCNYHKLYKWYETLAPFLKSVIYDEIQELRTGAGLKSLAAGQLSRSCTYRMGLTATPIYNYGGEMYEVMDAISPGCLGEREEFRREWCTYLGNNKYAIKNAKAFGMWLRESGLMLRRTRPDVGRELPPVEALVYPVEADLNALDKVQVEATALAKIILAQAGFTNFDKMRAGGDLDMKLRQATGIAKAPYVAAFVRMLVESGKKVVLYGWHHAVYDIWMKQLRDLHPVLYTGKESTAQKEKAKADFISGEANILVISLRAGAGLDGLQDVCSTVVFGELDWSSGVHIQCIGRLDRDRSDGKPNEPVAAFFLVTNVGSDPVMADVLQIKEMQLQGINNPDAELLEELQVDPDRIKKLAAAFLGKKAAEKEAVHAEIRSEKAAGEHQAQSGGEAPPGVWGIGGQPPPGRSWSQDEEGDGGGRPRSA